VLVAAVPVGGGVTDEFWLEGEPPDPGDRRAAVDFARAAPGRSPVMAETALRILEDGTQAARISRSARCRAQVGWRRQRRRSHPFRMVEGCQAKAQPSLRSLKRRI
jgi:hypothetical protein